MQKHVVTKVSKENQDLLRSSIRDIDTQAIARALLWLRGEAEYPYPTSIHLNLTLNCTARCVHCKQWTWPTHSELSVRQLEKLFEIFKSWNVKTITFGGGNPLLHNNILQTFQLANQAGLGIGIISEGIELTNELADAICQYSQWIRFSLDGPRPEIHDKIRNTTGLFNCVMEDIKSLRSRNSQLIIGLNCVVQKQNINILQEMIDLAESIPVDVLLFKIPHGEDYGKRFLPTQKEWGQFLNWVQQTVIKDIQVKTNLQELHNLLGSVFNDTDVVQGRPVRSFYLQEQVRCFAPLFFLTCDSEGNMYPCDYLQADTRLWGGKFNDMRNEFCLGNVLEDSASVLKNLAMKMHSRIHNLPASGYDECGSCTRFCQLNYSLTELDRKMGSQSQEINWQTISGHLTTAEVKHSKSEFL